MFMTPGRRLVRHPGRAVPVAACALALACGGASTPPAETSIPSIPTSAASALPASLSAAGPLLNSLGASVPGLSQAQQILGAGSLFGLARAKMPADQYAQVATAIPGADALANEATKQGLTPSSLGSIGQVTEYLGKSGIAPAKVSQLATALGQTLQGKVSPEVANSFMNALK